MSEKGDNYLTNDIQILLSEALQVPSDLITSDLSFGDLPQWDSLGHMDIMLRLEEQFKVEINTDTIAQLTSIPEICRYIEEKGRIHE